MLYAKAISMQLNTQGTTRDAFVSAHVVSAYSLVSTVRHALPFLSPGASVVALTYIGSQRVSRRGPYTKKATPGAGVCEPATVSSNVIFRMYERLRFIFETVSKSKISNFEKWQDSEGKT